MIIVNIINMIFFEIFFLNKLDVNMMIGMIESIIINIEIIVDIIIVIIK